jgi:transcriptional regulator with XRE-family HTH domain
MREYLQKLRQDKDLTQRDMAEKLCISESYYNLIENGSRQGVLRSDMLVKLASVLGLTVEDLLTLESHRKGA